MFYPGFFNQEPKPNPVTRSVNVGTVPKGEQCACEGFPSYEDKVTREMDKWEPMIRAMFPDLEKFGSIVRVKKETRYGPKWQLRFRFKRYDEEASKFADFLLANLPRTWPTEKVEYHYVPDITVEDVLKLTEDELDIDPFKF